MLSRRGERTMAYPHFEKENFLEAKGNAYHPKNNPKGYCTLQLAEYKLSQDLMVKKVKEVTNGFVDPSILYYPNDTRGAEQMDRIMVSFFKKYFKSTENLNLEDIICTEGVTASIEMMAFCLADPGDSFLVPAPNFFRFSVDVGQRMEVKIIPIPTSPKPLPGKEMGFELTMENIKKAYDEACKKGENIKGIMFSNPVNPTGDVYSRDLLLDIVQFAYEKNIHVISDEIYALSVYDPNTEFVSVSSLNHPDMQLVHVLWGVSKDFGLSGMKLGVIYTEHIDLKKLMAPMTYYSPVVQSVQKIIGGILDDQKWIDVIYQPEHKEQLQKAHKYVRERLQGLGIYCHPGVASLFEWANFSRYLEEPTETAEMTLFRRFKGYGVLIFPGMPMMCTEPGWFRLVVTVDWDTVVEGLNRIETCLKAIDAERTEKSLKE